MLFIGLVWSSCKKKENSDMDPSDKSAPVITLISPGDSQTYTSGDTVWIKGSMTDKSLHESLITLIRDSDSASLLNETPYVHDLTSYNFNYFWKSMATVKTTATLTITVLDHGNNTSVAKRKIIINP